MDVVITDVSGVTKVVLDGRLDTANVNQVETAFIAGTVPKGQHTMIDLTQVTFIASLGIRMLLSAARVLTRRGAKFVMYGATPAVADIIETTALSEIIPVLGTEAEAMAAING
jgi:anti-sigma B factor antagonist